MNIKKAFRESKDGRIRKSVWPKKDYLDTRMCRMGEGSMWEGHIWRIDASDLKSDDWEPYVEPVPETPEQMMRRVAREEIGRAIIETEDLPGWVCRNLRIIPADSDE